MIIMFWRTQKHVYIFRNLEKLGVLFFVKILNSLWIFSADFSAQETHMSFGHIKFLPNFASKE
jgi:hypothetical protein